MALLWVDGFDKYGDATGHVDPVDILQSKYVVGRGDDIFPVIGRFEGYGLAPRYNSSCYFQTPNLTTDRTLIVGFSFKAPHASVYPPGIMLWLISPSGSNLTVDLNSDGSISLYVGGSFREQSSAGVIPHNDWVFFQLKVYCDNSNGTWEARIGNTTVLQGTGDTQSGGENYYSRISISSITYQGDRQPHYDDLWICDSTGAAANDFLGPGHRVSTLNPSDDGDELDWTPNPWPDHVDNLDELVQDDTEYVESSTVDDIDLYDYESPGAMSQIKGLQVTTEAKPTDATPFDLKTVIKHDGTEDEDAGQLVGIGEYLAYRRLMEINPVTGVAWVRHDVDNLQAGVKVG